MYVVEFFTLALGKFNTHGLCKHLRFRRQSVNVYSRVGMFFCKSIQSIIDVKLFKLFFFLDKSNQKTKIDIVTIFFISLRKELYYLFIYDETSLNLLFGGERWKNCDDVHCTTERKVYMYKLTTTSLLRGANIVVSMCCRHSTTLTSIS